MKKVFYYSGVIIGILLLISIAAIFINLILLFWGFKFYFTSIYLLIFCCIMIAFILYKTHKEDQKEKLYKFINDKKENE